MAINVSTISGATTTAATLSNLLLVTPVQSGYQPLAVPVDVPYSPPGAPGTVNPPSFLFDYEGENTVALESDITDHYVEDNSSVQDQIALKPEMISAQGFIGELNDISPVAAGLLNLAKQKLILLSAYTPDLTQAALVAYNEAVLAYQTAALARDAAVSAWAGLGSFLGITPNETIIGNAKFVGVQNRQQVYFQRFYGYWRNRTLFTVQTPWAIFQNCAIKSLRAVQDAETNVITNFEVTFKVVRFTSTVTVEQSLSSFDARAKAAATPASYNSSTPNGGPSLTSAPLVAGLA